MRRTVLTAVAGAALVFASGVAAHAETPGFYMGLGGGFSEDPDPDVGTKANGVPHVNQDHTTDGFGILGKAGYSFGWFRTEAEITYRNNGFDGMDFPPPGNNSVLVHTPGSGNINSVSGMANFIWVPFPSWTFSPYLGVGIGVADIMANNWVAHPVGVPAVPLFDGSDFTFAYQGIVGADWYVNPHWSVGADFRYFATLGDAFIQRSNQGANGLFGYHTIGAFANVTYHFGSPPPMAPMPAAAPAPAPMAPARTFLVFFDFDKYNLTPDARRVIEAAAASYKANGSARIEVSGYTDLAGTQAYNLRLSQRRADAVAGYLGRQGVPKSAMDVKWFGKEHPRVPTPDGVREPQNRRVEIVMP